MKKSNAISKSVVMSVVFLTALLSMLLQPVMKPAEAGYDPTYGWHFFSDVETMMPAPHYFDLELDEEGNPHLAYFKDGINEDYLIYKYFDGEGWHIFSLDVVGELDFVSLELDENGRPHIAYHNGVSKLTTYAYFDGADWLTTPVTPSQQLTGMFIDLVLTSGGVPKIAFFSETASSLLLATFADDQFTYESVDSGIYFNFISLDSDEADQPGIAYCEGTTAGNCNKLKYAEYRESSWQLEILEEADFLDQTGNFASLTIDSIGNPHISYVSKESSIVNVKYASVSDHGWQIETIESWRSGVLGLYTSIALDGADKPSIAYYDPLAQSPDYQWWDGSAWNTNIDLDQTQMGTYINLELKPSGNPTLAFWDISGSTIALAEYAPGPDLTVSNFWVNEEDSLLTASIRNDGQGTYYNGEIHIGLYVNGTLTQELWPFGVIEPGGVFLADLVEPTCTTASPTMEVEICLIGDVDNNAANNCLVEISPCDSSPLIISDFIISDISISGFNASWTTNRPANTTLRYTDGITEQVYTNGEMVTSHLAVITGLSPHQVYYAQASSIDGASLFAKSARRTVKILAAPGLPIPDPAQEYQRLDTRFELYDLEAVYPDISNIEQVRFYLNDVLVGTDATPDGGRYSVQFSPGRMGYTRTDFFDLSHRLRTEAIPFNPAIDPDVQESLLEFQREDSPIEAYFITPEIDSTLVVPDATVPSGMIREVKVFAQAFEWECEYGGIGNQPNCEDAAHQVDGVNFYINNQLQWTDLSSDDFYYSFMWDMSGLAVGTQTIKAEVMAADGSVEEITASLHIEQGQAYITANRVVTRDGNLFHVYVEVKNQDISNADATFSQLVEHFRGFQPLLQEYPNYAIEMGSDPNGKLTWATIVMDSPVILSPGDSTTLQYDLVPVLFPDMNTAVYTIGAVQTKIVYSVSGNLKNKLFTNESQVWDPASGKYLSSQEGAFKAFKESDYVLITSPLNLFSLYVDEDVLNLIGDMALLAGVKKGVLAYWDPAFDKNLLEQLLQDNSTWTARLHPNFQTRYQGYVLIVGETEIIPSFTIGTFRLYWSGTNGPADYDVRITDNPYADTDGSGAPDLLLGRIIGNSAEKLDLAVRQSIDAHLKSSYSRAQAYVASGTGDGETAMQSATDAITHTLTSYGYSVSKHHWEFEAFLGNYVGYAFGAHDGLAHADLDGDGVDELIWARDDQNAVYRIDGSSGLLTKAFDLDFEDGDSLAAGDVDNDTQVEIIIGDRNDTIRAYDLSGSQEWTFAQDFAAWERITVGDVLFNHAGNEIVMADDIGFLHIFGYDSTITNLQMLRSIDIGAFGFNFSDHDVLRIGNITTDNNAGNEEILFSDLMHDKIIGINGYGVIKRELDMEIDVGDNFEAANVSGSDLDEIIFADCDNNIRTYDGLVGDVNTHYTHADFQEYDGLLAWDKPGYDGIFLFDRDDVLRLVDMNYPDYAISLFEGNLAGVDYMSMIGHGNSDGIGPAVNVTNFPVSFDEAHPIVTAWSCLTGYYEGNYDNGIAEAFLQSGAGIYVGATEVSPQVHNNDMGPSLIEDYWIPGNAFSQSYAMFKNNRWDVAGGDYWRYVVTEYNVYGDPKFDVFHDTTSLLTSPSSTPVDTRAGLVLDLPIYEVENINGIDYVEIPGGQLFSDKGQYQVPIYTHTIEYPVGVQVSDVRLIVRDGKTSMLGLNLPIVEILPAGKVITETRSALTEQTQSSIPGNDWSPYFESPFEWRVYDNGEEGSTLTLVLYPFYYDPTAQYSEYYQHFEFAVETVSTDLVIDEVVVDKSQYRPGEDVILNLSLVNTGASLDTVINAGIKKIGSGEQVGGFPLMGLTNLEGKTVLELAWNWIDDTVVLAGDYTIEIVVEDMGGNRLAQRSLGLRLGETAGEITTFEVTPNTFDPGETIDVDMIFHNLGDLPISGEADIQVQTYGGVIVSEYQAPINDLMGGETLPITFAWDSTGASEDEYRVVGFVKYNSQTTPTSSVILTVNNDLQRDVFLPLILR